MDNTIEEIFLSQGWPNDVIEKLKQLFDIRDLEKLSHIHYNTFSNYMRKYPFLDLETAAKIFILNLYNINFNIFEENIQDFINLLKIKDEMFIYQIIKMAENRIPINLILPIATNLDTDDLINFQNFYISFKPYDDSDKFSTLNFKYILPALKNINLDDMKLFSFFLSRNINNLNQAISLYKRLGSNKIFIFLLLKEKMKIDNDEDIKKLIDILSKISNQNANKIKKLSEYINNFETLIFVSENINNIASVKKLEKFLKTDVNLSPEKFMTYLQIAIKYSHVRSNIYQSLLTLNEVSFYNLHSFEDYEKYLSNFNDEDIQKVKKIFDKNRFLSLNNYFELILNNSDLTEDFLNRIEMIKYCSSISGDEAEYLKQVDLNVINNIIKVFFNVFQDHLLSFSDFILAQNLLNLDEINLLRNENIFLTIKNIIDITDINFRNALKLYLNGFNNYYIIQKINENVKVSVNEFKSIYYMINNLESKFNGITNLFFYYFKKEGIDFFDSIELAKISIQGVDEIEKFDKDWYYFKIKFPSIFEDMEQSEENIKATIIIYQNLFSEPSIQHHQYDFKEIRDIYIKNKNKIDLYDFLNSYYQYIQLKPSYSFSLFLLEKYHLYSPDIIEKVKDIDQNIMSQENFKISESFLYQSWMSEKSISILHRYATSNNFDKNLFPILFKNPILIGMNSNQIKNILEKIRKEYSLQKEEEYFYNELNSEEYITDAIKVYSVFKNPNILSKYSSHYLAQNIPDNLPYYELKGIDSFLIKYIKHKNPKVKCVSYNWNKIPDNLKIKNDVEEMFNYLIDSKIIDKNKSAIAMECDFWNISGSKFEEVEQIFEQSLRTPMPKWSKIPLIKGEYGFTGRFLPRNDPRGLFIGNYTDCCQKIGGAGEVVAIHSQTSPNAAIFVIEYQDNIIAQSWVFNDGNRNIIFDNIEKDFSGLKFKFEDLIRIIVNIYKEAATAIKKLGYNNVLLGANQYGIKPENYRVLGLEEAEGFKGIIPPDYESLLRIYPPDSYHYKLRLAMLSNRIDKIASDISDKIEKVINNG